MGRTGLTPGNGPTGLEFGTTGSVLADSLGSARLGIRDTTVVVVAPPPPPPFSPSSLVGLALWLVGGTGLTFNGDNISAWADQSGNGYNLSQGVAAAQPASQPLNGHVATVFSGAGGLQAKLDNQAANLLGAGAARTVFAALRILGAAFNNLISFRRTAPGFVLSFSTSKYVGSDGVSFNNQLTGPAPAIGTDYIVQWKMPSNGGGAGTGLTVSIDGAVQGLSTDQTAPETGGAIGVNLGDRTDAGLGQANNFALYELLVYDSQLSDADALSVRTYLGTRYGVTTS